jgi:hypothetical protein
MQKYLRMFAIHFLNKLVLERKWNTCAQIGYKLYFLSKTSEKIWLLVSRTSVSLAVEQTLPFEWHTWVGGEYFRSEHWVLVNRQRIYNGWIYLFFSFGLAITQPFRIKCQVLFNKENKKAIRGKHQLQITCIKYHFFLLCFLWKIIPKCLIRLLSSIFSLYWR